jgi:hydroxylamine dehydrogenase
MRLRSFFLCVLLLLLLVNSSAAQSVTARCVDCHSNVTPNIVNDWKLSKHSQIDVGCDTCHGAQHTSAADSAKAEIPTPDTCATCHDTQVAQFKKGKHALAWAAMKAMPTIHYQPMAMTEGQKGCGGCHKIGSKSPQEIAELQKEGSRFGIASCDACHTRHTFSVQEARQPQACQTCHMGFDHPQWEMYSSSKHGVRSFLKQLNIQTGTSAAPTCQTCHALGSTLTSCPAVSGTVSWPVKPSMRLSSALRKPSKWSKERFSIMRTTRCLRRSLAADIGGPPVWSGCGV